MSARFVLPVMIAALGAHAAGAQTSPNALLRLTMLDAKEKQAVERGEAVTKSIDAPEKAEIATLGIVRLEVPRAFYVDGVKELTGFLATGTRSQSETFSEPARLED